MNGLESTGKLLLAVGGVLALVGGVLWALSKVGFLSRLGHLPGDIIIERPGFSCAFPLVTSLLLSILLTVVLNVVVQIVRLLIGRGGR